MEKLSFSIPSKSKSKLKPKPVSDEEQSDKDTSKQYITEFDPIKTIQPQNTQTPIIQPIPNDYQPHKKIKNTDQPLRPDNSTDLRFEVESLSSHSPASSSSNFVSFGLNLRHSTTPSTSQTQGTRTEDVLLEKLRYDLKRLPEHRGFEEFEEMPVEDFAKALLRGYGWHEGRGIGKNAKEDVNVKQYMKRTDKEGLGFLAVSHDSKNRKSSSRDSNVSGSGNVKEKQRESSKDGFFLGKEVRVIGGKKEILGIKGTVVERLVSDPTADFAELGSREEEKCLKELKELQMIEERKSSDW